MSEEPSDELSPRAEIFRSKLIEDFQLLDIINDKGKTEAPKYYSNEITGENCNVFFMLAVINFTI